MNAGPHVQTSVLADGVRVVRAALPLLVTAAWVPSERMILVDERLDEADACAAVVTVSLAASGLTPRPAPVGPRRSVE